MASTRRWKARRLSSGLSISGVAPAVVTNGDSWSELACVPLSGAGRIQRSTSSASPRAIALGADEVVLALERLDEPLELRDRPAPMVRAELEERARLAVAADRDAVEVHLGAPTEEQVGVRGAREPVDLELDARHQLRRIDHALQTPAHGRVGRERALGGRLAHRRLDTLRRPFAAEHQGEPVRRPRADPQSADDAPLAQRVVGRVEVEIPVRGRSRLRRVNTQGQRCARQRVELRSGAELVPDDSHLYGWGEWVSEAGRNCGTRCAPRPSAF